MINEFAIETERILNSGDYTLDDIRELRDMAFDEMESIKLLGWDEREWTEVRLVLHKLRAKLEVADATA